MNNILIVAAGIVVAGAVLGVLVVMIAALVSGGNLVYVGPRWSEMRLSLGRLVATLVIIALIAIVGTCAWLELVPRQVTITVAETQSSWLWGSKGARPYLNGDIPNWVKDSDGNWYENAVNFKRLNFTVSDSQLTVGQTATVEIYGVNVPWLGEYPQIGRVLTTSNPQ